MAANPDIKEILTTIPTDPGVYKFRDNKGKLLYIGKAKNLRNRVRSYFSKGAGHSYRMRLVVDKIADISYTVTNSEVEALTLENNLIKEHQPKYNILLKDGKSYPFLCIKNERFPRIYPTRNRLKDGSDYYGPYTSVSTMNDILSLIKQNYKLRTCNYDLSEKNILDKKFKVCLEYQIGNCLGPCEGLEPEESYNEKIVQIKEILNGNFTPLLSDLSTAMKEASKNYLFEEAETYRSRIDRIKEYVSKNTIVSLKLDSIDVLAVASFKKLCIVTHFRVRNGSIIQTHSWEVRKKNEEEDREILSTAFERLAREHGLISGTVLSNHQIVIDTDLYQNVSWKVPQRGPKFQLIELALKNCFTLLNEKVFKQESPKKSTAMLSVEQLQEDLKLSRLPTHIECFDNSNIQGANPVASMVVFKEGKPSKKDYRKFNIKTVEGPDDFASMTEVVFRRYKRLVDEQEPLPQLIIIDGGKGQLNAAAASLAKLDLLSKLTVVGVAKKLEEIYHLGDPFPLHIDKRSLSLKLIQQLRNEAHRFAIQFHRDQRSRSTFKTTLTDLDGIGKSTASKLLKQFKSLKKIKTVSEEELITVIGKHKAELLINAIKNGEI